VSEFIGNNLTAGRVNEFRTFSSHGKVDPHNVAVIYAGLGDKDDTSVAGKGL
jgi:hypothetical protein